MTENIDDSPPLVNEEDINELNKFTSTLDQFNTVIPETVTKYYLQQSAVQTDDDRLVKLFSVSVQKFMSDIISDCFQLQKLREKSNNRPTTNSQPTTTTTTEADGLNTDQIVNTSAPKKLPTTNNTLTLNDLTYVLDEHGINVKKTFYYT